MHEITKTDGLVLAQEKAWHGLGTVVEQAPSIDGALKIAGLDWKVEGWALSATNGEGDRTAVSSHVANVRSDTGESLGVVGTGYVPLQNAHLAEFAESLMGAGAKIESAGSVRGGKRVWFLVRTDEVVELGQGGEDRVIPYVMLANGHDGSLAFTVQPTTIRVVCSNTLHMALRRGEQAFRCRHTAGMRWRVEDARGVLEQHGLVVKAWKDQAASLAAKTLQRDEIQGYFETVYAKAFTKPTSDRGEARRRRVLGRWEQAIDSPRNTHAGLGGTAWAALNVVTDYVDHEIGAANQTGDERHYRAWFGTGVNVKAKAWEAALATV